MSAPAKSPDSFQSPPENDLYPDLSSPEYIDPVQPAHEVLPVEATEEQKQEWQTELEKVEGEIATLRQVLGSKVRYSSELKRKLGITPMQEMKNDFQLGVKAIKESPAYQKTSAAAKTAAEKTSSVATAVGSTITRKLGDLRNSQSFKSVEGRVESAYAAVKSKVSGSKSENNFEEALQQEKEANGAASGTQDSLPEEKVPL